LNLEKVPRALRGLIKKSLPGSERFEDEKQSQAIRKPSRGTSIFGWLFPLTNLFFFVDLVFFVAAMNGASGGGGTGRGGGRGLRQRPRVVEAPNVAVFLFLVGHFRIYGVERLHARLPVVLPTPKKDKLHSPPTTSGRSGAALNSLTN